MYRTCIIGRLREIIISSRSVRYLRAGGISPAKQTGQMAHYEPKIRGYALGLTPFALLNFFTSFLSPRHLKHVPSLIFKPQSHSLHILQVSRSSACSARRKFSIHLLSFSETARSSGKSMAARSSPLPKASSNSSMVRVSTPSGRSSTISSSGITLPRGTGAGAVFRVLFRYLSRQGLHVSRITPSSVVHSGRVTRFLQVVHQ